MHPLMFPKLFIVNIMLLNLINDDNPSSMFPPPFFFFFVKQPSAHMSAHIPICVLKRDTLSYLKGFPHAINTVFGSVCKSATPFNYSGGWKRDRAVPTCHRPVHILLPAAFFVCCRTMACDTKMLPIHCCPSQPCDLHVRNNSR